ncbi:MAG: hypothetical protein FWG91_05240 [Lachnospiraceae bacterium]|nr:hypothetical protein [Lachnospiraceae bacterium]
MILCTLFVGYKWGVFANELGTALNIKNMNAKALCIRIVDRIEQYPDFDINSTPVLIVHEYMYPDNSNYPESKAFLNQHKRVSMIYESDYLFLTVWDGAVYNYIKDFIGVKFINSGYDPELIKESSIFKDMPAFPDKDSLAMIDGVLVVRLTY